MDTLANPPHGKAASRMRRRESDIPFATVPKGRRSQDRWLERWAATVDDLARLKASHPMLDAVIDEQRGRQIRIGECWLTDWASCNYLGFGRRSEPCRSWPATRAWQNQRYATPCQMPRRRDAVVMGMRRRLQGG